MGEKLYTTNQLAKLFGVVPTTIIDWVESEKLAAFKTLGGHRRITHAAVLDFLAAHDLPRPPAFTQLNQSILVLAYEQDVLEVLGRMLKKSLPDVGLRLEQHPMDALLLVGVERPRLIVVDVFAPHVDGFELCRRLRASQGDELKLLAMASESSPEIRRRALDAGADQFLSKSEAGRSIAEFAARLLGIEPPETGDPTELRA